MANLSGVVPGDVLVMSGVNMRGKTAEVTVTRVGSKYVYVKGHGRESPYSIATGVIHDNYGHTSLRTLKQAAEDQHRERLLREIKAQGLEPTRYSGCDLTTAQLERVVAALR